MLCRLDHIRCQHFLICVGFCFLNFLSGFLNLVFGVLLLFVLVLGFHFLPVVLYLVIIISCTSDKQNPHRSMSRVHFHHDCLTTGYKV